MSEAVLGNPGMTILIIDDELPVIQTLEQFLKVKGYQTTFSATSGQDGIELVKKHRPTIVLTDVMMPKMNGIEVLKAVKSIHPDAMVVVMTGYSSEDLILQAFQYGASNFLKKPFGFKSFSEVMDQVVDIHRARSQQRIARSQLVDFEVRGVMELPIDPAKAGEAVGGLINEIRPYVNGEDADSLHMCLYELVMNGIEHGVFRIGYDLKTEAQEKNCLADLYAERMASGDFAGRVRIEYEITPGKSVFVVDDSGEGFDVASLPDPTIDDTLLMSHGRGVMLTKMIADHLEYNEKGNRATLIKFQPVFTTT